MLKRIAVTGAVASGKSTVCQVFRELGAYVVNADHIGHQLLNSDTIFQKIVTLLGNEVVSRGEIDRKKVAAYVFHNPDLLQKLEAFMHPAIFEHIEQEYILASQQKEATLFVAEIPLLFETGHENKYNETIVVLAPEKKCIERFSKIGFNGGGYKARMKRHFLPCIKAKKANHIIKNTGSLEDLQVKAKKLFYQIQK